MKYYYTDPLAAAWMAKHHKMRFLNRVGDEIFYRNMQDMMDLERMKFYIHQDSLHLLNLQVGDMVKSKLGKHADTIIDSQDGIPVMTTIDAAEEILLNEDEVIIQRSGIPFMWPESEE